MTNIINKTTALGCALAGAAILTTLTAGTGMAVVGAGELTGPGTETAPTNVIKSESPGIETEFQNSAKSAVFVAQVQDGLTTGNEDPPRLVLPGQTTSFSHAHRDRYPEIRLRVYSATKQGLTQRWVKGALKEVFETTHNFPKDGLRVNVNSRPSADHKTESMQAFFGSPNQESTLDGNDQCTYVKRVGDSRSMMNVKIEIRTVAQSATADDHQEWTPAPSP